MTRRTPDAGPLGLAIDECSYQVGSNQLIRYGLATAESRAPRDALLPVLRAIWLDGQTSDAAGPGEQPQPPAPTEQPATPGAIPGAGAEDIGTSMPQ